MAVKVQEDFKGLGGDTLDKLDIYIAHCDAVVHLVGEMCGSTPGAGEQQALLAKYPDLSDRLTPVAEAVALGQSISYTQWEAWLALYHGKVLLTAKAESTAPRGPNFAPTDATRASQSAHLGRLEQVRRYPDCTFRDDADLARHIAYTVILDLLVKDYAREAARARDVAEGFIREMAGRVAADQNLDFEGMKRAVRNAIDIYESEIAGGSHQTNLGDIVDEALAKSKQFADQGKSKLARASLRKIAEQMQRDEFERRASFEMSMRTLFNREVEIGLAAYDPEAAAEAIVALAVALYPTDKSARRELFVEHAINLDGEGEKRGSHVHFGTAIRMRQAALSIASNPSEVWADQNDLAVSLAKLGEWELGTQRLHEAVGIFRIVASALDRSQEPKEWSRAQNNLGNILRVIAARTREKGYFEESVAFLKAAIEERSRADNPYEWALASLNLGVALSELGSFENENAHEKEAIEIFHAVLEIWTRNRYPIDWAAAQNNLGVVFHALARKEGSTRYLQEAIVAWGAAIEEWTRDRAPIDWARAKVNIGNALQELGTAEMDIEILTKAVSAYRAALEVLSPIRVPHQYEIAERNLTRTLALIESCGG